MGSPRCLCLCIVQLTNVNRNGNLINLSRKKPAFAGTLPPTAGDICLNLNLKNSGGEKTLEFVKTAC